MFSSFYHNAKIDKKWSLLTIAIVLLLGAPLLTILLKLFSGPGESWAHIKEYLLLDYLFNSLFLMVACSIFTLILGVIPAWLVSAYSFPFRKLLQWLLILPLAFPNYLTAYAYAGLFDYSGIYERMMVQIFNVDHVSHIDIMGIWGLAWVMSFSLYPYVYLSARSFFSHQSHRQMSAAKVLGAGRFKAFYSIALPLARPAVVGGLLLVMMEVLGDYGSAYYYGVSTYTTAIFRSWFALEEPETAVYLSAQLCMFILFLIVMERSLRGKKKYQFNSEGSQEHIKKTPKAHIQIMFMLVILVPILLGFILGGVVTLTSVGAGALGVTALLLLYPGMKIKRIIGTDIAHAVPLTLFAGLGHYNLGNVDLMLLGALIIGSVPGIWLGSYLSAKIDENKLRYILVIILLLVGVELILNN